MNQNFLINICILLTILILSPASAQRPETLRYSGNSYQVAEVVEVKGDDATLRTTNNKLITVPIRFLSSKLKVKAENIAKKSKLSGEGNEQTSLSVIAANASDTDKALQQSIVEGTPLKRWVNGTVSNEQAEEGLLVVSSVTALDIKLDRDGVPLPLSLIHI